MRELLTLETMNRVEILIINHIDETGQKRSGKAKKHII